METYTICDKLGLIRPIYEQLHYNIFTRSPIEDGYNDLIKKHKLGLITYSSLECGILPGKYINEIPKDSRANLIYDYANILLDKYTREKKALDEKLLKLKDIAEKNINISFDENKEKEYLNNKSEKKEIKGKEKEIKIKEKDKYKK